VPAARIQYSEHRGYRSGLAVNTSGIAQSVQRLAVGWAVWDRLMEGARFSVPVKTDPGVLPASYTMGTGPFPGVKRPGRGVDHHSNLVPRLKKEYSYTSTPRLELRGLLQGGLYIFYETGYSGLLVRDSVGS
jgi:hypothetical protein